MPSKSDPAKAILAAALKLAAAGDWARVTLADIAAEAKLPLHRVHGLYVSRQAVLDEFSRRTDERMLRRPADEPLEGPARDRLFDLLMRRFDALAPHKDAVRSILAGTGRDPVAALGGFCRLARSMALTLEAAGISAAGMKGAVRAQGLAGVYLAALRAWLADRSEDQAATMATLDKCLRRAENLAELMGRRRPAA